MEATETVSPSHRHQAAVTRSLLSVQRRRRGWLIVWFVTLLLATLILIQSLHDSGRIGFGFVNWRPLLYAYLLWSIALGWSQILIRGDRGRKALFILPAALFTLAVVVFPTVFGLSIAFTNWNLSSFHGRQFNGIENFIDLLHDSNYANALLNMVYYTLAVPVEYAVAFALALALNAEIRARRFFRVVFLLPFMLSPIAVSWMVGKSLMETRFGPIASLARWLGWENPMFFSSPWIARASIEAMDAWAWIPFMMIMMLAGLQALPKEIKEAAAVDGANRWQNFWLITFPLLLPVSVTAITLRIIFKLKLADIVINVTDGAPGGATDTVTSYIFRVYRDRSNVGYGTMLAMVYLIIIIVFITLLLKFATSRIRRLT